MEPRKFVVSEFVLGDGALNLAGRYAANLAARKVMVVTDPGVIRAGWTSQAMASLESAGIKTIVFDGVSINPKDKEVMNGADMFAKEHCDMIVAVEGGSPMDCAKGIGIVVSNQQDILQFEGVDKVVIPPPPLICIPTTAGSAADISQFAIISDTKRKVKIAIINKANVPDVALVDPRTTTTMPGELTAATGIDALVHAVEAYVSNANSPVTDIHALEAIRLVWQNLPAVLADPQNMARRDAMMLGSLLAGFAFSNASLGLVHAMAHSLGGLLDLPHGECNALLLEHVIAFNFENASDRYLNIAETIGLNLTGLNSVEAGDMLIDAIRQFRMEAGITRNLRDCGVTPADLPGLAQSTLADPCIATNPRQPGIQDVINIYERAL